MSSLCPAQPIRRAPCLKPRGNRLVIAAGQDAVAPRTVQLAGKRPGIAELLRGHKIEPENGSGWS